MLECSDNYDNRGDNDGDDDGHSRKLQSIF